MFPAGLAAALLSGKDWENTTGSGSGNALEDGWDNATGSGSGNSLDDGWDKATDNVSG
jgi:hypothetical protein